MSLMSPAILLDLGYCLLAFTPTYLYWLGWCSLGRRIQNKLSFVVNFILYYYLVLKK